MRRRQRAARSARISQSKKYRRRRLGALLVLLALAAAAIFFLPGRSGEPSTDAAAERRAKPQPSKPPPSDLAYPGYYPVRYEIEAEYTERPRAISGTQRLRYVNAEKRTMDSLQFRLWTNEDVFTERGGGTGISAVTVDGEKARFEADGTNLEVSLPKPLPENATAEIVLEFETKIPEIAAPFGHEDTVSSLGVWYPVLAVYDENGWNLSPPTEFGEPYFAEVSDYEVRLTLPRRLSSVATGVEKDRSETEDKQTVTYEARAVRDFALAIGENFSRKSRQVSDTTVTVHYLPDSAFRADRALDLAAGSLELFSELFGPYPYPELDIVDAPLLAGTEYSTLTFVSMAGTEDYLFDTVIPHEVAHQWWYVQVGNDQFSEPWLDESLATYSEWLFTGDAATRFPDPVNTGIPLDSPVAAFPDNTAYQNTTYTYGAQLYRELSAEIGEHTLTTGLHNYVEDYRYGVATKEDLIETLSEAAGRDLTPFFKSYSIESR